jgi:Uma2 family endonuclease
MAASATATAATAGSATNLPIHRLDVDAYNRIVASGALEGERVELLDGLLVEVSPQSPAHATLVERLMLRLAASRLPLRVQSPLEVPPGSEPEPDLAVFAEQPPPDRHPHTAVLAIEVAVSSQTIDRSVKAIKYAHAGIPTYWLIDVPARTVEIYTEPGESGYGHCERRGGDARLPCGLEGVQDIDLAALFEGIETGEATHKS